jgi:hypothetical protein
MDEAWSLDAVGMYALRGNGFIVINSNFYAIEDLDIRNLSRFELHAQKMCYYVAEFLRKHAPGFERAVVAHVGVDLGVRASRYILGRGVLKAEQTANTDTPFLADDVIATMPVANTKGGPFFKLITYDVPFGVTVPRGCDNLLVGSAKSISTEPAAIIRGMSGCMICGQAAGAAGALAARSGAKAAEVPIRDLQRELIRQGVRLGDKDRLKSLGL